MTYCKTAYSYCHIFSLFLQINNSLFFASIFQLTGVDGGTDLSELFVGIIGDIRPEDLGIIIFVHQSQLGGVGADNLSNNFEAVGLMRK